MRENACVEDQSDCGRVSGVFADRVEVLRGDVSNSCQLVLAPSGRWMCEGGG